MPALACILLLTAAMMAACSAGPSAEVGDEAKDFSLPSISGVNVTLSDYRGRNILLFFWAEGCVFCRTDNMLSLNDVMIKGRKSSLVVLSVNIGGSKGEVSEFVRQKGLKIPVLLDRDARVSRRMYGVHVLPSMFIIDGEGLIRNKAVGVFDKEGLMEFVGPYLGIPSCRSSGQGPGSMEDWERRGVKCTSGS